MRRNFFAFFSVLGFLLGSAAPALALPSLDPILRTQLTIDGAAYTLIRDASDPYQWYYVPPHLRLVELEKVPQLRVVTYVADGRSHAIVQAQVTAAAPEEHEAKLKAEAMKWYAGKAAVLKIPVPQSVQLVPIGPVRCSRIRLVMLQASGNDWTLRPLSDPSLGTQPVTYVKEKDKDGNKVPVALEKDEKPLIVKTPMTEGSVTLQPADPNLVARGLSVPGGTYLTQGNWIQFEIEGEIAVGVYKELIRGKEGGKAGGLCMLMEGEYDALSVPANVKVSLDLEKTETFFRNREVRQNGWRFLCFGGNNSNVHDFMRAHTDFKECLKIEGTVIPQVSDAQYQAVSAQLVAWVTGHVCKLGPAKDGGEPPNLGLPNASVDLGGLSVLVGLPPLTGLGLSVGANWSRSSFTVDFQAGLKGTKTAEWTQRFVVPQSFVLSGAVGLGKYSDEQIKGLVTDLDIKPLPQFNVRMPSFGNNILADTLLGARVSLTPKGEKAPYVWGARREDKAFKWVFLGDPTTLGIDEEKRQRVLPNTLLALKNTGVAVAGAECTLDLIALNAHINKGGPDALVGIKAPLVRKSAKDGLIDFAGERFPFRQLTVDPGQLPFGDEPGTINKLVVLFGSTGDAHVEARPLVGKPIVMPRFDKDNRAAYSLLYGGTIDGFSLELAYTDLLSQKVSTHTWTAKDENLVRIRNGSGGVTLGLEDLGLRVYELNLQLLAQDFPDARTFTLDVESDKGGKFSKTFLRDGEKPINFRFLTAETLKSVRVVVADKTAAQTYALTDDAFKRLRDSVGPVFIEKPFLVPGKK